MRSSREARYETRLAPPRPTRESVAMPAVSSSDSPPTSPRCSSAVRPGLFGKSLDRLERGRDQHAAGSLAEQRRVAGATVRQPPQQRSEIHAGPDAPGHAALRQRAGQAAVRDVVRRAQAAAAHGRPQQVQVASHELEVDVGQPARERSAQLLELGARQRGAERPEQRDLIPLRAERDAGRVGGIGQLPDHADHRRGVDRAPAALVVERDVAAHHRHAERLAGGGETLDRARELPGDVRLLRVAEVEAVREPERLGADAGEVGGALEHRLDRALVRIAGHPPAVPVDRHRQGALAAIRGEGEHGGVGRLGAADRARAHDRVVLLERPALARDARRAQQGQQRLARLGVVGELPWRRRVDRL